MGQPWLLGELAAHLDGRHFQTPTLQEQADGLCEQIEDSLSLYGESLGIRIVRKHVAAHIDRVTLPLDETVRRSLRAQLCRLEVASDLIAQIQSLYSSAEAKVAA